VVLTVSYLLTFATLDGGAVEPCPRVLNVLALIITDGDLSHGSEHGGVGGAPAAGMHVTEGTKNDMSYANRGCCSGALPEALFSTLLSISMPENAGEL
jgi:hypothetical protein